MNIQILLPINFNKGICNYLVSSDIKLGLGDLVIVPFRNKRLIGMVWSFDKDDSIDSSKLRYIEDKLNFTIPEKLQELIIKTANYYCVSFGEILKLVLSGFDEKVLSVDSNIDHSGKIESNITLSHEQEEIYDKILSYGSKTILLNGVTGSGKTQVYAKVIAHILNNNPGAQSLIMLPEICLTTQILDRLEKIFGIKPVLWHSQITPKARRNALNAIINGNARIILGARSALYLPYKNLGIIVVDEEHDQSYKQEDGVCYNARDMAVLKGFIENIPVLLSSATPSIETVVNVNAGKFKKISLPSRYNNVAMPDLEIVDMKKNKNGGFISDILREEILSTINKQKQIMLYLNRRGYSPLVLCKSCGYRFSCPDCSAWMVKHKKLNILKCHHCDLHIKLTTECPSCSSNDSYADCGPGVERIEEEVKSFVDARILVVSKDTISNLKDHKAMIDKIQNNEVDIIIGTQMISKGLHFPNLESVGIIDADMSLNNFDLRAAERTFQTLSQVAGRAGRESGIGKVILQTFYPENSLIKAICENDHKSFLESELYDRKNFNLPPYNRYIAIILSDYKQDRLKEFCKKIVSAIPINKNITVLGPAEAPIFKIRNRYRYRFLIKGPKNVDLQGFLRFWLEKIKIPSTITIKIDVDPYNFS